MNVRTEALAFRIWAFAEPKDWDCSIRDIAEYLKETPQRIAAVCRGKSWVARLRSSGPYYLDTKITNGDDFDVMKMGEKRVD
jgi:hypothetical protein